ncbi:MAG: Holliday junction branch migration protein RuvA [Halanaerobiales bacterium]|nr:Holliday junction branch migration protein RuvA [Halanaerobiales bacterium]
MIAYLRGKLLILRDEYLVIDVNGVGYQIFATSSLYSQLQGTEEEICLHIHTAVREDAITLYGFLKEVELDFFKLLITVSGIGPKVGLSILSTLPVSTLRKAILYEDVSVLKKVPGIGEKTAKRLILELKNKMNFEILGVEDDSDSDQKGGKKQKNSEVEEAVDALMVLGYSRLEAFGALEQISVKANLELMIRHALKYLGQGRS